MHGGPSTGVRACAPAVAAVAADNLLDMWAPVAEVAFLAGAGVLAGVASSSGAIGSLVSYPALLAVGIPPLAANVTNAVAVTGVGLGASLRSRPELRGTGDRLPRWALIAAAGAAVGATLLLNTPGSLFAWIVPFLVAAAALVLLLQPRIVVRREAASTRKAFSYGLFAVALYEGYFGAGAGVMTLAMTMLTIEASLPRANAVKNALLGIADLVAAAAFTAFGPVRWPAAVSLGIGFLAGGTLGPSVVRRVPAGVMRALIAAAGFVLASWLLLRAIGR